MNGVDDAKRGFEPAFLGQRIRLVQRRRRMVKELGRGTIPVERDHSSENQTAFAGAYHPRDRAGFGRWTQFLAKQCQRLILVDLSEKCIAACQKRFRDYNHVEYHVNDGRSLAAIKESSVDFVFSFDSLVHVEADVIESYVNGVARTLKIDGTAFLHHSNFGEFSALSAIQSFLWSHTQARSVVERLKLMPNSHGRALSMSASKFREYAKRAGVHCTVQETINWGGKRTIDCFSTLQKSRKTGHVPTTTLHNPHFMREAGYLGQLSRVYQAAIAIGCRRRIRADDRLIESREMTDTIRYHVFLSHAAPTSRPSRRSPGD